MEGNILLDEMNKVAARPVEVSSCVNQGTSVRLDRYLDFEHGPACLVHLIL